MQTFIIEELIRNYIEREDVAPSHFTTATMKAYIAMFPDGQVTRERACQFLVEAGQSKCLDPWKINVVAIFENEYNITKEDFEIDYEASYAKYKSVGVEHYGLVIYKVASSPEKQGATIK